MRINLRLFLARDAVLVSVALNVFQIDVRVHFCASFARGFGGFGNSLGVNLAKFGAVLEFL